jgi:hypothetical protein
MRLFTSLALFLLLAWGAPARAATTCVFATAGTTLALQGDCTTDASILIPDGFTLDMQGYTITAVDPAGGHFMGAVIRNAGAWAAVFNGVVNASGLANVCDGGADRLRGVMFDGAAGYIRHLSVTDINQGPSGCQEGNAIEVRNEPFDGTHPNTLQVEVAHNTVTNWQKTGIVVNGDVNANIHHNVVGASATQANLAANSVQVGFGALAAVEANHVAGNAWCCSDTVATAILLFDAGAGTRVFHNNLMDGNADIGIYISGTGIAVDNNRVFESGPDTNAFGYDVGIGDYGATPNAVTNNKVRGYQTPYEGVAGGRNKVIPSPND